MRAQGRDAVFVRLPEGAGKSAARAVERRAIEGLRAAGFPLWSAHDGAHRHFAH